MTQNFQECLYDNQFYGPDATVTVDPDQTTPNDGQAVNAYDWFDWTLYVPTSNETDVWIAAARSASTTITHAAVYQDPIAVSRSFEVELETGVGTDVWSSIGTIVVAANASFGVLDLTPTVVSANVRTRLRWTVGTDSLIRQVFIGRAMVAPIGQFQGLNPPTLIQDVVTTNTIAVNGSFLGRDVRRTDRSNGIDLMPVDPAFVRDEWEPFANEAVTHAFIWRWAPQVYPSEVAWAVATSIVAPVQASPSPKLQVTMPIRTLI